MTDKELLEFAAKAAGHDLVWGEQYYVGSDVVDCTDLPYIKSEDCDVADTYWHPLECDADALRLAVQLNIDFYQGEDDGPAAYAGYFVGTRQKFAIVQHGDDPYAATRRAIIRAAAEIGKAMP